MLASLALAATSALLAAAPADAFFILGQKILVTTRLDPIVSPGGISQHVHSIAGGSNFDKSMTFASAQASTCTTAQVSVDKSNYWVPQLYYYNPKDESYQAIPASGMNAYYLPRGKNSTDIVRAFPDGLRMISGDPFRRDYDGSVPDQAISFVCLDYNNNHQGDPAWAQRNSFFEHNCPNGMRVQVNFPSCWDGKNLDSPDHKSHMAFASAGPTGGGSCPSTHPVHLVTLFYEFFYDVQKFPFNPVGTPTWVFANGDTTGYGMHGDFLNGWPSLDANGRNVLQDAIEQCNDNNGVGGVLKNCPPFVPFLDSASASACQPQNPQVEEDVGFRAPLKSLPGDNPIWIGDGPKPSYGSNWTDTTNNFTDFKSVIPQGYQEVGCIAESTSGRALQAASFSNNNMTRAACVSWCSDRGYPLAGVEYGRECYCDLQMRGDSSNTTLLPSDRCSVSCANNQYENCGGGGTLTLFNNPNKYPTLRLPTGWTSGGCRSEATSGRALKGYSFAGNDMTPLKCIQTCADRGFSIAGAEYGRECYCGSSWSAGAVDRPTAECKMTCAGDPLQICGAGSRLTWWTNASAAAAAAPSSATSSTTTSSTTTSSTTAGSTTASSTTASSATTSSTTSAAATTTSSTTTAAVTTTTAAAPTTTAAATTAASPSPSTATGTAAPVVKKARMDYA